MQRTYRYRIYPKAVQETALHGMLGALCDLYNAALEERIDCWRKTRRTLTYNTQALHLKEVRAIDERLAAISFTSCQQVLRRLHKTFGAFFARIKRGDKPGFPRFKSKRYFDTAEFRVGDGLTLKQERLRIVGVPDLIKVKWHRKLPANARLAHATLSRSGDQWHVCFAVELPIENARHDRSFSPVGIDVGITSLAALSTGETIENPKWVRTADAKTRRLQRALARKKRHSRGWRKAKAHLKRQHARIVARRNDFLHKLSSRLVREHSHIAHERLNIKGLARGMLAREVLNAGWSRFFDMLAYKAANAGVQVEAVDPNGTSQTCPACGGKVEKTLRDRKHHCPHCGLQADRDVAAAQVVLLRAKFMGPGIGLAAQSKATTPRLAAEAVCFS